MWSATRSTHALALQASVPLAMCLSLTQAEMLSFEQSPVGNQVLVAVFHGSNELLQQQIRVDWCALDGRRCNDLIQGEVYEEEFGLSR